MEALEKELKELDTNKDKPLNGKQEKFCQEYVKCLNKGKAYSIAYNSPYETTYDKSQASSAGCALYGKPRIQARIKTLVEEANKKCDVSLEFIIQQQLAALERMNKGKKEKKLTLDGQVVDTGEIEYDNKAINGAIKNLADFTGLSKQVIEAKITGKQEVSINKVDALAETLFNGDD